MNYVDSVNGIADRRVDMFSNREPATCRV